MKKTPKKILEIATYMRNTGDFSLDIRYLTANEIGLIKAMISNDAVFEAVSVTERSVSCNNCFAFSKRKYVIYCDNVIWKCSLKYRDIYFSER